MATVPRPGTILTGDIPTGQIARFSFRAPSDFWIRAVANGLFNRLVDPDAWTQGGTFSEDDAAALFSSIVWTIDMSTDVGQYVISATVALPVYCLPCDGASYLRADYPQLFAAIGVLYGSVDSSHFNVPDVQTRTVINSGGGFAVGDTGGEQTHTLTTPETPAHVHDGVPILASTAAGLEPVLASVQVPIVTANTGSTGGGGAHNNMQPYIVGHWGIIYTDDR